MSVYITRPQLLDLVHQLLGQSQLLPGEFADQADELSTEELEKLTITLHWALKTEQNLDEDDKSKLADNLVEYLNGKRRIYEKTQRAWLNDQEAAHEHQECLFEEALLKQL